MTRTFRSVFVASAVAAATCASSLLWHGAAHAQCRIDRWYDGTPYYDVARLAQAKNAAVYGAARTVDTQIMPRLRRLDEQDADTAMTFYYGFSMLPNATRIPAHTTGCDDAGYVFVPYDLYAGQYGFGARHKDFSAFYAASVTGGVAVTGTYGRTWTPLTVAVVAGGYGIAAPVLPKRTSLGKVNDYDNAAELPDGVNLMIIDYTAGLQYENKYVSVRAGYVSSQGLYAHAEAPGARLFATSVLSNEFANLSYLIAGVSSLHALAKDVEDVIGRTALYGRRLQYPSPQPDEPAAFASSSVPAVPFDFWTAHLRQLDIAKYFDANIAVGISPSLLLHVGRIGVHTKYHHYQDWLGKSSEMRHIAEHPEQAEEIDQVVSAGIEAGMVSLPAMPYYAVKGGNAWSVNAEARILFEAGDGGAGWFRLRYRYNEPELLAMFPYAQGAHAINVEFAVTEKF